MSAGSFPADWLALREPFDHAARSQRLLARWAEALPDTSADTPPTVLDLGCGRGSNLRYTAPRLPRPQRWVLVDHDEALLLACPPLPGVPIDKRVLDLDDAHVDWPRADAVTTQALLDLVGESWLSRLVQHLVRYDLPLLAALTVDGRVGFHPSDRDDDLVMRLFRSHQLTSRGFGPSLGPRAAPWLAGQLSALGFEVEMAEADWHIPSSARQMLDEMISGIAGAASESTDSETVRASIAAWAHRRRIHTEHLAVGHLDLVAIPASARGRPNRARS